MGLSKVQSTESMLPPFLQLKGQNAASKNSLDVNIFINSTNLIPLMLYLNPLRLWNMLGWDIFFTHVACRHVGVYNLASIEQAFSLLSICFRLGNSPHTAYTAQAYVCRVCALAYIVLLLKGVVTNSRNAALLVEDIMLDPARHSLWQRSTRRRCWC